MNMMLFRNGCSDYIIYYILSQAQNIFYVEEMLQRLAEKLQKPEMYRQNATQCAIIELLR